MRVPLHPFVVRFPLRTKNGDAECSVWCQRLTRDGARGHQVHQVTERSELLSELIKGTHTYPRRMAVGCNRLFACFSLWEPFNAVHASVNVLVFPPLSRLPSLYNLVPAKRDQSKVMRLGTSSAAKAGRNT